MARPETLRLPAPTSEAPGCGLFDAQVVGQPGIRRGLREGAPALERARAAYLSTEWRGPDDRRPEAGLLTRIKL